MHASLALLWIAAGFAQGAQDHRRIDVAPLAVPGDEGLAPETWLHPFEAEPGRAPAVQAGIATAALAAFLEVTLEDRARPTGVRVEPLGVAAVEVSGPAGSGESAARIVDALAARLAPGLELVVEHVPWEPGAALPLAPGAWPEATLATVLPHDVRRAVHVELRPGHTARAELVDRRAFVSHHAVQIASGAFIHVPEVAAARAGWSIAARAWPTPAGDHFALRIDASDVVGTTELAEPMGGRVALADSVAVMTEDLPRTRMELVTRSWLYTGPAPRPGTALLLHADWSLVGAGGGQARGAELWIVRLAGSAGAPAERIPLADGRLLDLVSVDALGEVSFRLAGGRWADVGEGDAFALVPPRPLVAIPVELARTRPGGVLERLPGRPRDWHPLGPWLAAVHPPGTPLPAFLAATEPPAWASVAAELVPDAGSPVAARLGLPVSDGSIWHVGIAVVTPIVGAVKVEVAGQVSARSQDLAYERRGLAASARAWVAPGGWRSRVGMEARIGSGALETRRTDPVLGGVIELAPASTLHGMRTFASDGAEARSALVGSEHGLRARVSFRPMAAGNGTQSPN